MPPLKLVRVIERARHGLGRVAATPDARGVLYDLPQVVEGAPELLKNVIHDWADAESVTILSNVRKAATPGGTLLLLVELVIPTHNREFLGKCADMEMLVQAGARERTATEYRKLLEQAGFQMTRVVPTAAPFSLVEGKAV